MTDHDLVARAQNGDNQSFGQLWRRHQSRVRTVCMRFVSPGADPAVDSDDLAADCFVRALLSIHRFDLGHDSPRAFANWMTEVARRTCLRHLAIRRRRSRLAAIDSVPDVESHAPPSPSAAAEAEERWALRAAAEAINALPVTYRDAFRLFLADRSHEEVGAALGISPDAAAKRVQRSRAMLKQKLGGVAPEGAHARPVDRRKLRNLEREIADIAGDVRVVDVALPSGGIIQLCLRSDERPWLARHPAELAPVETLPPRRRMRMRLDLADVHYHAGRWPEAEAEYRQLVRDYPTCFQAYSQLAAMMMRQERDDEAAELLSQAPTADWSEPLRAQHRGALAAARGDWAESARAYAEAVRLAPRDRSAYVGLDTALAHLSRYEEQLQNLEAMLRRDRSDIGALVGAYTPCALLKRFEQARGYLERAVELDPNYPPALKHLFQVRMNLGLYDAETLELAQRLVRIAPGLASAWSELAWIYHELARHDESIAVLEAYLRDHPESPEAHASLAWRCHYLARYEERGRYARAAYALAPRDRYVVWTMLLACCCALTFSDAEAAEVVDDASRAVGQDAYMSAQIAGMWRHRQREEEAMAAARQSVALSPDLPDARLCVAETLAAFDHSTEATHAFEHALCAPGAQRAHVLCLLAQARFRAAAPGVDDALAQAAAEVSRPAEVLWLGMALEQCGRVDEARDAYRTCVGHPRTSPCLRQIAEGRLKGVDARGPSSRSDVG